VQLEPGLIIPEISIVTSSPAGAQTFSGEISKEEIVGESAQTSSIVGEGTGGGGRVEVPGGGGGGAMGGLKKVKPAAKALIAMPANIGVIKMVNNNFFISVASFVSQFRVKTVSH